MSNARWMPLLGWLLAASTVSSVAWGGPGSGSNAAPRSTSVRAPWPHVLLNLQLRRQEHRVVRAQQSLRTRQLEQSAATADHRASLHEDAQAHEHMMDAARTMSAAGNETLAARRAASQSHRSLPTEERVAAAEERMRHAGNAFSASVHVHDATYARVHDQPGGTEARLRRLRVDVPVAAARVRRSEHRLTELQTRARRLDAPHPDPTD